MTSITKKLGRSLAFTLIAIAVVNGTPAISQSMGEIRDKELWDKLDKTERAEKIRESLRDFDVPHDTFNNDRRSMMVGGEDSPGTKSHREPPGGGMKD